MNPFKIQFQDGSKLYVKAGERDDLLLRNLIKPLDKPKEYKYVGQAKTYHTFIDWGKEYVPPGPPLKRFYPGSFIFEHEGKRHRERLETPEAYAARLNLYEASQ